MPETKPNDQPDADPKPDPSQAEASVVAIAEAPVKFRVMHGAVSGVAKNKKGEKVEHDYHCGQIVSAEQLDGNADIYLIQGAIAFVE